MIPSLNDNTYDTGQHPDAPAQLIAVMFDAWTPRVEATLTQELMQLQSVFPALHLTAVPPKDHPDVSGFSRVARMLRVPTYEGEYAPEYTHHLVYFNDDATRPASPASGELTRYTFLGTRVAQRRMRPGGNDYPVFPDRTRVAPMGRSPMTMTAPARGRGSFLPFWAYL